MYQKRRESGDVSSSSTRKFFLSAPAHDERKEVIFCNRFELAIVRRIPEETRKEGEAQGRCPYVLGPQSPDLKQMRLRKKMVATGIYRKGETIINE